MRQIHPDLWVTEPEHPLPDELPDLTMHAFLLVRPAGNVLFCRSEHQTDHEEMRRLGGVSHHYLTHWHEAGPGLGRVRQQFDAPLHCHLRARDRVARHGTVDHTFEAREIQQGDIEVIPTPGHTPGSTCFLFRSPHGGTYLFAGDTLFPSRGGWQAVVFEDGDKAELRRSLSLLHGLEPDVVLFGAAVADEPVKPMSADLWHSSLDEAARSLA